MIMRSFDANNRDKGKNSRPNEDIVIIVVRDYRTTDGKKRWNDD